MPLFNPKLAAERQGKLKDSLGNVWKALSEQPKIKPADLGKMAMGIAQAGTFPFSAMGKTDWDYSGPADLIDPSVGHATISNFPSLGKFLNTVKEPTQEPINNFVTALFRKKPDEVISGISGSGGVGHTLMDLEKTQDAKGLMAKLMAQHPDVAHVADPTPLTGARGDTMGWFSNAPDRHTVKNESVRKWASRIDPNNPKIKDAKEIIAINSTIPEAHQLGTLAHEGQHKIEGGYYSLPSGDALYNLMYGDPKNIPDGILRKLLDITDHMAIRDVPTTDLFKTPEMKKSAVEKIMSKYKNARNTGEDSLLFQYLNTALHHKDFKNYELDIPGRALFEDAVKNNEPIHDSWKQNYFGLLHKLKNQK